MAITTVNAFVNNLADVSVSGVTRYFDGPPSAPVQAADLPAMFPRIVEGRENPMTFQTHGGWPDMACELVILVQKAGLDTVPTNHQAVVDVIDDMNTALRALSTGNANQGRARLIWAWRLSNEEIVNDTLYWAIVVRVEGRG